MAFDLNKALAEAPKATVRGKKRFPFVFDGEEFSLPNELDVIALRCVVEGDFVTALQRVLTPAQYRKVVASPTVINGPGLASLFNEYYEHIAGLTPGNSSGSTRSSKSTAGPSKRTSTTTTRKGRSQR